MAEKISLDETMILVEIRPDNEGPLSPVSKRPILVLKQIRGELEPGSSLWIEAAASSPVIVSKDIGASDREKVEAIVRDRILDAKRYPTIRFDASRLRKTTKDAASLEGELTLHGRQAPLSVVLGKVGKGELRGTFRIRQTDFGIKPYIAFLGALRSSDELEIEVTLQLPALVPFG